MQVRSFDEKHLFFFKVRILFYQYPLTGCMSVPSAKKTNKVESVSNFSVEAQKQYLKVSEIVYFQIL
jgi:starvation-inducible outer membrane lipoprotein